MKLNEELETRNSMDLSSMQVVGMPVVAHSNL